MDSKILLYLFYLCLVSLIVGPLGVLPLGIPQVNIYITDLFVGLLCLVWVAKIPTAVKIVKSDSISKFFCIFLGVAVLSWILSPVNMGVSERFISSLYFVRLLSYFSLYLTGRYLIKEKKVSANSILRLLVISGIILAGLGWLQYIFYPDLRNLYYLGWDPHFARIFSTYLDPNYFGLMLVLSIVAVVFEAGKEKNIWFVSKLIFLFLTLMFTYSRSSYLAFIVAAVYFFFKNKKYKLLTGLLMLVFISMLFLPRPAGVGVQLERVFSIETRVENWQQAMKIVVDHPILGVGFNTVRYAKSEYNYPQDNLSTNHAGAGFDNSFLFIAATTGLVGLLSYLLFLGKIFAKGSTLIKTSLIAIVVHSFFLNSLFFPWVMVWMWVVLARDDFRE